MFPDGNGSSAIDPGLLALLNQNGGFGGNGSWLWIFFLFFLWPLIGGNGWFGNNGGNGNGFGFLANQANNDAGRDLLMSAIQGNGAAINQLASTLNVGTDSIRTAVNGVMSAVQNVGNQVGMTSMQTINAIQAGNSALGQQLASCCCQVRESICNQGFESRLATLEQTNQLSSKIDLDSADIKQAIQTQTTMIYDKFCDLEKRELQNKIDELQSTKNSLESQISNANQTNAITGYINSLIVPLSNQITAIKNSMPSTATVQYPQLTVVPSYLADYNYNNSIWS